MLRRTLTTLSLIGLLLSVGLWGVSYFSVSYGSRNGLVHLNDGAMLWHNTRVIPEFRGLMLGQLDGTDGLSTQGQPYYMTRSNGKWQANLPFWIPLLVSGLVFCLCRPVHHHRRRKRRKLGLCLKCGYDLRASKDICPECGEEFDEPALNGG